MIRQLLAATAFAALATASMAADLPNTKGPAVFAAPPVFTWAGPYIGLDVGYAWRRDKNTEYTNAGVADGWSASSKPKGMLGGLYAGYNFQYNSIVYGIEGDIEATDIKGTGYYSLNGAAPITDHIRSKTDFQGSLRARLGLAAFDRTLIYVTGGVAFADLSHTYQLGLAGASVRSSSTKAGWTLGAGLEYAITNNWIVRGEYRYTSYGKSTNNSTPLYGNNVQRHRITDNAVRVGIAYKF
jgi:outer membrane immunogenic protein